MNEYLFKLTLLFIPGVWAVTVLDQLIIHREWKLEQWIRYSVLISLGAYGAYSSLLWCSSELFGVRSSTNFTLSLNKSAATLDFREICFVSFIATIVACLIARKKKKNWLFRLAKWLKVSPLDSPYSVFQQIMRNDLNQSWVRIRDHKNNLVYQGWIQRYSDDPERDELYLRDVKVYDNRSGEFYYDADSVFMAFCKECHTIEREIQNDNIGPTVECDIRNMGDEKNV